MANTGVTGRITRGGAAAAGLVVRVYDQDRLGIAGIGIDWRAQQLGSAITDPDGRYSISYSTDKYGDSEDRERVSGRLEPPRYEWGRPDLFIEVYDGDRLLARSNTLQNVEDDVATIDVDVPVDAAPDRRITTEIVDFLIDTVADVTDVAGTVLDRSGNLIRTTIGGVTGRTVDSTVDEVGDAIRDFGEIVRNEWEETTDRSVPPPDEVWNGLVDRYRVYKRAILLRHFFPPRKNSTRFVPCLVTESSWLGFTRTSPANDTLQYDPAERRAPAERRDYDTQANAATFRIFQQLGWSMARFIEHLDVYARAYENGLCHTSAFLSALAYEQALPGATPETKVESERLITLIVDTLEDLELRGGLSGCIPHCHEQDDALRRHEPGGDEYAWLIEGLAVAYHVLPATSDARFRIRNLLARIDRYLQEHVFYIVRPGGNFTFRGAATPYLEFPWRHLFWQVFFRDIAGPLPDTVPPPSSAVWHAAGITGPDDIVIDDHDELLSAELLRLALPPAQRFQAYSRYAAIGEDMDPSEFLFSDDEGRPLLSNNGTDPLAGAPMPVWTLWTLARSANLGRWTPDARPALEAAFRSWFNDFDHAHTSSWGLDGNAWNPHTIAVAVALTHNRSTRLWSKLHRFLTESNSAGQEYNPAGHLKFETHASEDGLEISERGAAGSSLMWTTATIAHCLGRPVAAPLREMRVPGPLPDPRTLLDATTSADIDLSTLPFTPAPEKPDELALTVRDLLDAEWKRRDQRLQSIPEQPRPVFIVAEPEPAVQRTLLLERLEAERPGRVFLVAPAGELLDERGRTVGERIAKHMREHQMDDLAFDVIAYGDAAVALRSLLVHTPSALGVFWPVNAVLLGMTDTKQDPFVNRPHHPDTRFCTAVGVIDAHGDGLTSVETAQLRPEEAANLGEQEIFEGVAHSIGQGDTWYFTSEEVAKNVLAWIAAPGQPKRCPQRIDPRHTIAG